MHQLSDVIKHFGGISGLAAALECTTQAISQWDELIPEQRAYQIEVITKGKFKASQLPVKKRGQAGARTPALSA